MPTAPSTTHKRYLDLLKKLHGKNDESVIKLLQEGILGDDAEIDETGLKFIHCLALFPPKRSKRSGSVEKSIQRSMLVGRGEITEGMLLADCLAEAVYCDMGHLWPHFVKAGADLSTPAAQRHVALIAIFENKDLKTLKAMIRAGVIIPRVGYGVFGNSESLVRWMMARGADVNERSDGTNWPALFEAAHYGEFLGRLSAWHALLNAGADIHARDGDGYTALLFCARMGSAPLIRQLLKRGASPNETTPKGDSGLHIAAKDGTPAFIRFLVKNGFDPHLRNNAGETPVDVALAHNNGSALPPRFRRSNSPRSP